MDRQVRLKAHLRDLSWEGGCVHSAHHIHPREAAAGCLWFGREIGEPSRLAVAAAAATAPIATTTSGHRQL